MPTIFVAAGDASGELHTSAFVEALRQLEPGARFLGLGGPEMEKAGVELVVHQRELAVGGFVEVLRDLRRIVSAWRRMGAALKSCDPDLVVLVDSPDFNLPFARKARRAGAPILYYVSPQVWAWRRYRIRQLARRVDRIAVIFPFEVEVYASTGLQADFVGHPLVDRLGGAPVPRAEARVRLGIPTEPPLVALLPGSRRNEVRASLPLQLRSALVLREQHPDVRFAVGVASSIEPRMIEGLIADEPGAEALAIDVVADRTHELIAAADVALTKPGTVTVEIALIGTPMVVAARVHPFTAAIARRVVKVPSFTMVNLIAGAPVVPEFLQEAARPERVARALAELLEGPCREAQRQRLAEVCERLGSGGAAERAARVAQEMLRGHPGREGLRGTRGA
jgi:lipid-A-disaccharide synthase